MKSISIFLVALFGCIFTVNAQAYRTLHIESNSNRYQRELEELRHKQELERLRQETEMIKSGGTNSNGNQQPQNVITYHDGNSDVVVYLQDDSGKSSSRSLNSLRAKNFTGKPMDIWVSYLVILYDKDGYEIGRREENFYKQHLSATDYAQNVGNIYLTPKDRGLYYDDYCKIIRYKPEKYVIY